MHRLSPVALLMLAAALATSCSSSAPPPVLGAGTIGGGSGSASGGASGSSQSSSSGSGGVPVGASGSSASGAGGGSACGTLGSACCAGSTCTGSLTCRNGSCGNAPANGTGMSCSKNSDCPSGVCLPDGSGNVCTTSCSSVSDCVAGWACSALVGQSSNICQCTHATEQCDGLDNDCDGIPDEEPLADQACVLLKGAGYLCQAGACGCSLMCGAQCVDPQTDASHCGNCATACLTGQSCQNGSCGCPSGQVLCGTTCVNEQTDSNNCGACGMVCPAATPQCTTGACSKSPSCTGLGQTCGPAGNGDCCASPLVTGITSPTFYRSYDGVTAGATSMAYPAQVSTFHLDTYEVTVGRFRKFVAAYSQTIVPSGAGANPNNPSDTGWNSAWNADLDASSTALIAALKCDATHQTWTDTPGTSAAESLPINCLDWYEAEAFCTWDRGRLPTEAEWNYAAAGGALQRVYPWGNAAPDCTYANYELVGGSQFCELPTGVGATFPVGTDSPKGDGYYGQADLAGNIWEWVQDWYVSPYPNPNPCINCANLTPSPYRGLRSGGAFSPPTALTASDRFDHAPGGRSYSYGVRCARAR